MVNSNANALGIIFPNSYDSLVPELVSERLMASIPFAGRYRMVDFILSSMVNCGIDNISIIVRKNYHSLMDHLGSGREWDLVRKNGGLNIVPPFAEKTVKVFNGRVEALASILDFLMDQKEKYVVMSDANIAVNFDFKSMIDAHIASGADVTVAYKAEELPRSVIDSKNIHQDLYYTLDIKDGRVTELNINEKADGIQNYSMNIYIIERTLLIEQIRNAYVHGYVYYERDILTPQIQTLNVQAFEFKGYTARICDMKAYFDENMKLLKDENLDALFSPNPIYTKIRDDNPTRYIEGAKAKNIMAGRRMRHRGRSRKQHSVPRRQNCKRRSGKELCPDAGYGYWRGSPCGIPDYRQKCYHFRRQRCKRLRYVPILRIQVSGNLNLL